MTPNDLFTAALAKSRKNQPGITATPAELLATFRRVFQVFFTIGARVNPAFFGTKADVAFSGGAVEGWPRPADAESIYLIRDEAEEKVIIVPFDELDADPFSPAVYEWGQVFYAAGNALDPVGESAATELTFWYSKKPDALADADTELDPLWPDSHNELLVLELAIILALKDERMAEVSDLRTDRDSWLQNFVAHLEHATTGVTRSTGTAQRFTGPTYVPLNKLLAGGTEVSL